MKKLLSVLLTAFLLLGVFGVAAFGEEAPSATVFVTVSDKGSLAIALEEITVTDADGDGVLTINDALYAAHEAKFEGGAEAGYASASTDYGISITKLWGDVSGSYGYYNNNASAWSLADPVKDGDMVYAFVYSDVTSWSDTYSFFDVTEVQAQAGREFVLTLYAAGYDENWNPVTLPVEGATVTVNGVATEIKTDAEGKAKILLTDSGEFVISAVSENANLVPPVCVATAASSEKAPESTPETGDDGNMFVLLAVASIAGMALIFAKKRVYEN